MEKENPVRTTLYLPPTLWKQCKLLAVVRGCTATEIVAMALSQYLAKVKHDAFDAAKKGARA
jgi:hypothetical protein